MTKQEIVVSLQRRKAKKGWVPFLLGDALDVGQTAYRQKGMARRRVIQAVCYKWDKEEVAKAEKLVDELIKEGVIEIRQI